MKQRFLLLLLLSAALLPGQVTGDCSRPFDAFTERGKQLAIDIRSGDIEITGTTRDSVRVACQVREKYRAGEVKITLAAGHLRVFGGPTSVHVHVEVPDRMNLLLRGAAGNITIAGVTGDKDVELNAGNLTIQTGSPSLYKVAEGSVMAGNLTAPGFDAEKNGLFRSFKKEHATGQFRLRAKLLAGNLTLK